MTDGRKTAPLDDWSPVYSGKVRDLYEHPDHPALLLVVASDRVSAFDHVLEPGIPGKGAQLTSLSNWWFERLASWAGAGAGAGVGSGVGVGVGDHRAVDGPAVPERFAGRGMVVRRLDMLPVECVVRGYLSGSGWLEYRAARTVCGIPLPTGLHDGDRLPEPIYTPAWKAPMGEHDENISFDRTVELVGAETAAALRDTSLDIFARASAIAAERGLILADTKFEFGTDPATSALTLADEVLTSDSSRYWDAQVYAAGGAGRLASFDKQIVRDWLAAHWDRTGKPPALPAEIVERTADRYRELIDRLTS